MRTLPRCSAIQKSSPAWSSPTIDHSVWRQLRLHPARGPWDHQLLEASFAGDEPLGAAAVEHKGQETNTQAWDVLPEPWRADGEWGRWRVWTWKGAEYAVERELGSRFSVPADQRHAATLGKVAGESAWKAGHRGANKVMPFSMALVFLGILSPWHLCFPWRTPVRLPVSVYTTFIHPTCICCMPTLLLTLFMGFLRQEYWSGSPSLLQWTMFCQNSPPWLIHLGLEGFPW